MIVPKNVFLIFLFTYVIRRIKKVRVSVCDIYKVAGHLLTGDVISYQY